MTFKVVTSILNFYIPTTCMIVLYVRIFLAIKRRSRDIERLGAVAGTSSCQSRTTNGSGSNRAEGAKKATISNNARVENNNDDGSRPRAENAVALKTKPRKQPQGKKADINNKLEPERNLNNEAEKQRTMRTTFAAFDRLAVMAFQPTHSDGYEELNFSSSTSIQYFEGVSVRVEYVSTFNEEPSTSSESEMSCSSPSSSSRYSPVTLASLRSRSSGLHCDCSCHEAAAAPVEDKKLLTPHRASSFRCRQALNVGHRDNHVNVVEHSGHRHCYRSKIVTSASKNSSLGLEQKNSCCRRCSSLKCSRRFCVLRPLTPGDREEELSFSDLRSQSEMDRPATSTSFDNAASTTTTTILRKKYADESQSEKGKALQPRKRKWLTFIKASSAFSTPHKSLSSSTRYHPPNPNVLSLAKEKKAATQLGVIVGAFILCWLPYFTLFMVVAYCGRERCVNQTLFTTTVWFGYFNSALNPILYPLCNANFKRAFKRMLGICDRQRTRGEANNNGNGNVRSTTAGGRKVAGGIRGSNL